MGGVLDRLVHPFGRASELARCESVAATPGSIAVDAAAAAKPGDGEAAAKPGAIAVDGDAIVEAAAPTTTSSSCGSDPNVRLVRGLPPLVANELLREQGLDVPGGREHPELLLVEDDHRLGQKITGGGAVSVMEETVVLVVVVVAGRSLVTSSRKARASPGRMFR